MKRTNFVTKNSVGHIEMPDHYDEELNTNEQGPVSDEEGMIPTGFLNTNEEQATPEVIPPDDDPEQCIPMRIDDLIKARNGEAACQDCD